MGAIYNAHCKSAIDEPGISLTTKKYGWDSVLTSMMQCHCVHIDVYNWDSIFKAVRNLTNWPRKRWKLQNMGTVNWYFGMVWAELGCIFLSCSSEWPAYSTLKSVGFIHSIVNHQENYVNPASGTNTQGIERSWLGAKIEILRKMRGTTEGLLQSQLNEYCYRVMRKQSPNLLIDFLNDVKSVYRWMYWVFQNLWHSGSHTHR